MWKRAPWLRLAANPGVENWGAEGQSLGWWVFRTSSSRRDDPLPDIGLPPGQQEQLQFVSPPKPLLSPPAIATVPEDEDEDEDAEEETSLTDSLLNEIRSSAPPDYALAAELERVSLRWDSRALRHFCSFFFFIIWVPSTSLFTQLPFLPTLCSSLSSPAQTWQHSLNVECKWFRLFVNIWPSLISMRGGCQGPLNTAAQVVRGVKGTCNHGLCRTACVYTTLGGRRGKRGGLHNQISPWIGGLSLSMFMLPWLVGCEWAGPAEAGPFSLPLQQQDDTMPASQTPGLLPCS